MVMMSMMAEGRMPEWVFGCVLTAFGSIIVNLGTNVVKLSHNVKDETKKSHNLWWAGMLLSGNRFG